LEAPVLSGSSVAVRHVLLAIGTVLVLGLGVFLFVEVRSSPAAPPVVHSETRDLAEADDEPAATTTGAATGVTDRTKQRTASTFNRLVRHPTSTTTDSGGARPSIGEPDKQTLEGVKLEETMAEANKAYDRMDFDEARTIAQRVLAQHPDNTRMLRIMVSAACIENDQTEAQKHYNLLPNKFDRDQMRVRCARYGVTFTEPLPK